MNGEVQPGPGPEPPADRLAEPSAEPLAEPSAEPPAEPPFRFQDLVEVFLAALLSLGVSNVAGLFVLRYVTGREVETAEALRDVRFLLPVQFAAYALLLAFVYGLVRLRHRRPFAAAVCWRPAGVGVLHFLAAGAALAVAAQLVPALFPTDRRLPIEELFTSPQAAWLLAAFGIGIAPFVEELVFRGIAYPVFARYWGMEPAVLLSAALFAGIHVAQVGAGIPQVTAIFLVGVALSYARGRTGSLVAPFLMHVSYNTTLFAALYVTSDGFRNFKG